MDTEAGQTARLSSMTYRQIWGQSQRAQGNSERTIVSRDQLMAIFERHAQVEPATATTDHVVEFMASVRHLSKCTRATYFSHLRAWFRWLVRSGVRADDPTVALNAPKTARRRPRPVSDEQLAKILATPMRRRSRMMVMLATYQGLRVHEIAKIRGEDVDLVARELRVIGKGDEDFTLPLHPAVASFAKHFPRRGYWFVTHIGNVARADHVLGKSISDIIANIMTRAEVAGGAHRLRHWYGTKLVAEGVNIRIVQELLRHASLQTTQIYTAVTLEQQRAALHLLIPPMPPSEPGALDLIAA